ncbi:hypothetical protein [Sulfurovum sp.]|uniref:hypothetical protein n=1 Tax=Sulfurovum sp. TaxID=1969726 RepID=UPI0025E8F93F|nr:hypothetical protein [Sulfurovum sp.]
MRKIAIAVLVGFVLSISAAKAVQCNRTVLVKAHSKTINSFTAGQFIDNLGGCFAGSGVTLTAGAAKPEYILGATQNVDGPFWDLGVSVGFVGGDASVKPRYKISAFSGFPAYIYGDELTLFGFFGRKYKTLADFAPDVSSEVASYGGMARAFETFEHIPVQAEHEVDNYKRCFNTGETGWVTFTGFKSDGKYIGQNNVRVRLIAKPTKGTIEDGAILAGDDRAHVYARRAPTKSDYFSVRYKAPDDPIAKDTMTLSNSCEIRSSEAVPLGDTPVREQIAEAEIAICNNFSLEYNHHLKVTARGSAIDYTIKGSAPLFVDIQHNPDGTLQPTAQIKGKPVTMPINMSGSIGGRCTLSYKSSVKVAMKGEARQEWDDGAHAYVWRLYLLPDEVYAGMAHMILVCPGHRMEQDVPFSPQHSKWDKSMKMKVEDQETVEQSVQGAGAAGTYQWILHVPEGVKRF